MYLVLIVAFQWCYFIFFSFLFFLKGTGTETHLLQKTKKKTKTKTKNQTNGATLGGRGFPQDESPGTSSLGGESLLPMVMKTSGLDISIVGGPLQCPLASHFSQQVKGISGPAGK